jgi:hypothetical protein
MIPLNYESPPSTPVRRHTSTGTRFALGVGIAFLVFCIAAGLHGDIDIAIGPACSGAIMVGSGGAIFSTAGVLRKLGRHVLFIERGRRFTVSLGAICAAAEMIVGYFLGDAGGAGAWAMLLLWIGISAAANWVAIRALPADT